MDTYNGVYVVTNPWESALAPDGKRLYTIYAGTNDMNISAVIDDDYQVSSDGISNCCQSLSLTIDQEHDLRKQFFPRRQAGDCFDISQSDHAAFDNSCLKTENVRVCLGEFCDCL